jgi:alpha-tubulin suppressor-like RCC1 family protein
MLKRTLLSLALAVACSTTFAATTFYVVVPLKRGVSTGDSIKVALSTGTPPEAIVGSDYAYDLKPHLMVTGDSGYSGAGVTWTTVASSLPAGLSLSAEGVISGTPTAQGSGTITARAAYRNRKGEQTYQLVSLDIQVSLASATLPDAKVGSAYAAFDFKGQVSVTGDPNFSSDVTRFSSTDLPAGLSLSDSGVLSGTPTFKNARGAPFTVTASYKTKTGLQAYTLVINGKPLDVTQISAGYSHTCAVTTSGGAMCWGSNIAGQLGTGSTAASAVPVQVAGLSTNVASISAGYLYTCALTTAGAVKCWGTNNYGQLGDGGTASSSVPVDVRGISSGASTVSAGIYHACALVSGAAQCWGYNLYGQLGNNTNSNSSVPVNVSGLTSGVAQLKAGYYHSCAVTSAGAAKCWGYNNYGQLGNNGTTSSAVPSDVTGLSSGVASIVPGYYHSCAITSAGAAKCWGWNSAGQLGNASTTNSSVPVPVTGLGSGTSQIATGYYHSCAVSSSGLKCWGQNSYGQLGNGTANSSVALSVLGLPGPAAGISVGRYHTCATSGTKSLCWGYNNDGELGDGTTTSTSAPLVVEYP